MKKVHKKLNTENARIEKNKQKLNIKKLEHNCKQLVN